MSAVLGDMALADEVQPRNPTKKPCMCGGNEWRMISKPFRHCASTTTSSIVDTYGGVTYLVARCRRPHGTSSYTMCVTSTVSVHIIFGAVS